MIIIGLGTVWILDGLEVTIVGNLSGQLAKAGSGIHITQSQVSGFGAALAFAIGAGLMIIGGLVEAGLGVKAERRSLEDLATPLTAKPQEQPEPVDRGAQAGQPAPA